jgi:uncharacterized membrane protein (UPF0127 family)
MAQAVATKSLADRIGWDTRVKPALIVLVIAAIAYAIGAFWMAPRTAAQGPAFVPSSFTALPLGSVLLTHPDGVAALLPVRIADTSPARETGFRGVGADALDNTFLLYVLTRETTNRASYVVDGIRTPIAFAAIDASGTVVSVTEAPVGGTRVSIADKHQWLIASRPTTLERFGVTVGATIDPAGIRKF